MSQSQSLGPCSGAGYQAPMRSRPTSTHRSQIQINRFLTAVHSCPNSRRESDCSGRQFIWRAKVDIVPEENMSLPLFTNGRRALRTIGGGVELFAENCLALRYRFLESHV